MSWNKAVLYVKAKDKKNAKAKLALAADTAEQGSTGQEEILAEG